MCGALHGFGASLLLLALASPPASAIISAGLNASSWKRAKCGPADMTTQWTSSVTPASEPAYPRPQLTREAASWVSLNGLWEWERVSGPIASPAFGKALNGQILVPFPPESCLSGIGAFENWPTSTPDFTYTLYRLVFDEPALFSNASTVLLNFGALDWNATVWLNTELVCSHVGGYSGFSCDLSGRLLKTGNELFVFAHDPTDLGAQPEGKQRIASILAPGGDKYTPTSGIWQTVFLEKTPAVRVVKVDISTTLTAATFTVFAAGRGADYVTYSLTVTLNGAPVSTASGVVSQPLSVMIPSPSLWTPDTPTLYDVVVSLEGGDEVGTYFGLRTISLAPDSTGLNVSRPLLNGKEVFLAGWLDQSFWPDGQCVFRHARNLITLSIVS